LGAAATAASAALAGVFFVLITLSAALAYSMAGSGNDALTSGLNDVAWVCIVMASFPAAMLIMAGTFGLWRAGIISNALFSAGVAAVVLVLLGGTTWASDGIWAPDGAYSRFISPIIGLAWITVISALFVMRSPSTARAQWGGGVGAVVLSDRHSKIRAVDLAIGIEVVKSNRDGTNEGRVSAVQHIEIG
jgi:hypothetical protein